MEVIPTIGWSDPSSWWWCFDGEPEGSVVAVSSRGCAKSRELAGAYRAGFGAMMERLRPSLVLAFGGRMDVYDDFPGRVVPVVDEYRKRMDSLGRVRREAHNGR